MQLYVWPVQVCEEIPDCNNDNDYTEEKYLFKIEGQRDNAQIISVKKNKTLYFNGSEFVLKDNQPADEIQQAEGVSQFKINEEPEGRIIPRPKNQETENPSTASSKAH